MFSMFTSKKRQPMSFAEKYATQLQQLENMGYKNRTELLEKLEFFDGDVTVVMMHLDKANMASTKVHLYTIVS